MEIPPVALHPCTADSRTSYYLVSLSLARPTHRRASPPVPPADPSRCPVPRGGCTTGPESLPGQANRCGHKTVSVVPGICRACLVTPPAGRRCGTTCAIPIHRRRRPGGGQRREAAGHVERSGG